MPFFFFIIIALVVVAHGHNNCGIVTNVARRNIHLSHFTRQGMVSLIIHITCTIFRHFKSAPQWTLQMSTSTIIGCKCILNRKLTYNRCCTEKIWRNLFKIKVKWKKTIVVGSNAPFDLKYRHHVMQYNNSFMTNQKKKCYIAFNVLIDTSAPSYHHDWSAFYMLFKALELHHTMSTDQQFNNFKQSHLIKIN